MIVHVACSPFEFYFVTFAFNATLTVARSISIACISSAGVLPLAGGYMVHVLLTSVISNRFRI